MMVSYIIIEDERPAYEELKRMVSQMRPDYRLAGWADSIEQAGMLMSSGNVDLIFMDIHLADGLAFDLFADMECEIPVVFTTAYDRYALDAFRAGGIDYLLKPIEEDELETSLRRFEKGLVKRIDGNDVLLRKRFKVKVGEGYRHIPVEEVAFFHAEDKCTFVTLLNSRTYIVESALDAIEGQLDRFRFFRISRSHIVNIDAIVRCSKLFGGRLRLHVAVDGDPDITVSRARAAAFLEWYDGLV